MMDAKRYMQQIRLNKTRIETKQTQIQNLLDVVTKTTPTLTGDTGGGGGSQDKFESNMAKIVDLKAELANDIVEFAEAQKRVGAVLDRIENPDQIEVLSRRYIGYERWEDIAEEMHMSFRNVTYIHGKALQSVTTILESADEKQFL